MGNTRVRICFINGGNTQSSLLVAGSRILRCATSIRPTMKTTGNTILITGGGSGIGRGLAEAFHALGNQVIIAGEAERKLWLKLLRRIRKWRRRSSISRIRLAFGSFAGQVTNEFPKLNVLINNAGITRVEKLLARQPDLADAEAIVTTNLLGPIRLTAALLPLLRSQPIWRS